MLGTVVANGVDRAEIAFVEPAVCLLSENTRHTFAVKIYPLIAGVVETLRQIFETVSIKLAHLLLDSRGGIGELNCRQRVLPIRAVGLSPETRLGNGGDQGGDGALFVVELGGANEIVLRAEFVLEVVEHQHTMAKAFRSYLEA